MRVLFEKFKQRDFIKKVLIGLDCPSLKELQNRIAGVSYSSLKNYFSERRMLPYGLFLDLCKISNLNFRNFKFELLGENWGKIKGGKKSSN